MKLFMVKMNAHKEIPGNWVGVKIDNKLVIVNLPVEGFFKINPDGSIKGFVSLGMIYGSAGDPFLELGKALAESFDFVVDRAENQIFKSYSSEEGEFSLREASCFEQRFSRQCWELTFKRGNISETFFGFIE